MTAERHSEINTDRLVQEIRAQVQRRAQQAALAAGRVETESDFSEPTPDLVQRLRFALTEVKLEGGRIGQPTPEPPTIRGRIGSKLMRLLGRVFWWYTFHIQAFVSATVRYLHEQIQTLDSLMRSQRLVAQAVNGVRQKVAELEVPMREFREDLQRLDAGFGKLESANFRAAQTAESFAAVMSEVRQRIEALASDFAAMARTVDSLRAELDAGLTRLERRLDAESVKLDERLSATLATERQARDVLAAELKAVIGEVDQKVQALAGDLATERQARDVLAAELKAVIGEVDQKVQALAGDLATERQAREDISHRVLAESERERRLDGRISELGLFTYQTRAELRLQERRISVLLKEARKRLPKPFDEGHLREFARVDDQKHNAVYLAFENVLRGTREEIRSRQSVYLPILRQYQIGSPDLPVLDIGCGRGEWLELLRENGMSARGVDRNEAMVEFCRALDLDVTQADALEYLNTLQDSSLGAVTALHVVEHLPFDTVIDLLDEVLRVLKPGGLVIVETPNPANLLVGAHTFYLDPTHQKPLPSALLRFFVEARGFCDVSVKELHLPPSCVRLPEDSGIIATRLNDYLYGPQDYAVMGRKP